MLNMKDIADYSPCYIISTVCPANGVDLPRKKTLFDVCDGVTNETVCTFNTARQAKRFAHKYIADPEGAVQQKRQLSADRITHVRALWAISLLLDYMDHDMTVVDKHRLHVTPKRYMVTDIFLTAAENMLVVKYFPDDESISPEHLYIDRLKTVRAIAENVFSFETYEGKVYTFIGKD